LKNLRTDLALEAREIFSDDIPGIKNEVKNLKDLKIHKIIIKNKQAEKYLNKSRGKYITIEIPDFIYNSRNIINKARVISGEIKKMLPKKGLILVAGLGNLNITPDALGPKVAEEILATRHIKSELPKDIFLNNLRATSVISPGVLGQTGIDSMEIILSIVKKIDPKCVILIDALAARSVSRLGHTVQISNTGISPGSGVGNSRPLIDEKVLKIPVVSIGVPTVVDAETLLTDVLNINNQENLKKIQEKISLKDKSFFVTPREIDLLIKRAAKLIGISINLALNPSIAMENLLSLN